MPNAILRDFRLTNSPLLNALKERGPLSTAVSHIRWISAFMVMVGHVRPALFPEYQVLRNPSIVIKFVYFVTLFPEQAVICFFVISGLLVGGRALGSIEDGAFNLSRYAIDRLVRLYIVLVPSLLLCAILVFIQMRYLPISVCGGTSVDILVSLISNLAFLQNTVANTVCNNFPLWSLANEGWYYVLFPLGALISLRARYGLSFLFLALIALLFVFDRRGEHGIANLGPIWLIGVAILCVRISFPLLLCLLAFLGALILSRTGTVPGQFTGDYIIAITLAFLLRAIAQWQISGAGVLLFPSLAERLSKFSYSLYLVHIPILFLAQSLIGTRIKEPLDPLRWQSWVIFSCVIGACILTALLSYVCFERHTKRVRLFINDLVGLRPSEAKHYATR